MTWESKKNKRLIQAILALEHKKEAACFLRDLMTENEIIIFAKRLQTAEMLTQKIPYTAIRTETGLSSTTIARVAKWLNGKWGGYRVVIKKLQHYGSI